jgi:hypothetical protein
MLCERGSLAALAAATTLAQATLRALDGTLAID